MERYEKLSNINYFFEGRITYSSNMLSRDNDYIPLPENVLTVYASNLK